MHAVLLSELQHHGALEHLAVEKFVIRAAKQTWCHTDRGLACNVLSPRQYKGQTTPSITHGHRRQLEKALMNAYGHHDETE